MNDPHVVTLHYRVQAASRVTFDHPPPIQWSTEAFAMHFANDQAVFTLKEHYASEQATRERLAPFLRAWELLVERERGRAEMQLVFDRADVIDRNPPPPGVPVNRIIGVSGLATIYSTETAVVHITHYHYPDPPVRFRAPALIEEKLSNVVD